MKTILNVLVLVAVLVGVPTANAGPWKREFQDIQLPSQEILEHDTWAIPLGSSAGYMKTGAAIASVGGATTISTFLAQPDYAKNILLTPTGTTANVASGTAVVSGLNIYGKAISENFTITSTQSTATTGSKAFASVTSVSFPQANGSGVTLSIGTGVKLGLRRCLNQAGDAAWSVFNSAFESTRGTTAASATAVESNTFIPTGSIDGAKPVDLYYIENFRCYPGQ